MMIYKIDEDTFFYFKIIINNQFNCIISIPNIWSRKIFEIERIW